MECTEAIEVAPDVPRVRAARIQCWFGRVKGFPGVEQLAAIAERGAPVHVAGDTDVNAALAYSNHRRIAAHVDSILANKIDDLRFGRTFMFLRSSATHVPNLRFVPLAVVVSPSKTRVIHELTFAASPRANSVNADADFEQAPTVELGGVLHELFRVFCTCVGGSVRARVSCWVRLMYLRCSVTLACSG